MSWSGLSSTQWVSDNNLQDAINNGIFATGSTSIPADNRWVKVSNAALYIQLDTTNTYYSAKASNQWVAVRDLTPLANTTLNIYILNNGGGKNLFTVQYNSTYLGGTSRTLPGSGATTTYNTNNPYGGGGRPTITLSDFSTPITVSAVVNASTGGTLSYSLTGNGTTSVAISVTINSTVTAGGIRITIT